MKLTVRFYPPQCPECGAPVEANYTQYRRAPRHPLFVPLLFLGAVGAIGAVWLALWGIGVLTTAWTAGMELRRMERGVLYLVPLTVAFVLLAWLCRWWWRFVHGLSRSFVYECPACGWSGTVRVVGRGGLVKGSEDVPVGYRVEAEDTPDPNEPLDRRRERQLRRLERERRQVREQEHERPPNPDFDFKDR